MNLLAFIPEEYVHDLGVQKLGMCEFFCLLFTACECLSVLKNMVLCGLPVPKKVESWLRDFLANMTSELPVSWQLCNIQKERIGWAALFKSHCTRPHPVMKKKRKTWAWTSHSQINNKSIKRKENFRKPEIFFSKTPNYDDIQRFLRHKNFFGLFSEKAWHFENLVI